MLSRQRIVPKIENENEELVKIACNHHLTDYFMHLAKDLDYLEPKTPEQIFKTHLEDKKNDIKLDSAQYNLASTYVNAFANIGIKKDTLMSDKKNPWVNKVKDIGILSAVASLGLINLWDTDNGINDISEYFDMSDVYSRAGACIGVGLLS